MRGWTTRDIPDLRGRRAIVTGANSGLGYHTALQLARRGAAVVLACRSAERGRTALDRIRTAAPGADVELGSLDLADLASVRAFAARYGEEPLDLLVNNAGVMAIPHRTTADGFEMQFGTNHLGHFALTGLLLPALRSAPSPRVVTLTSAFAWSGRIDFDDLQSERRYRKWAAYAQSKLANLMFSFELARRLDAAGSPVRSLAAHPGYAATNVGSNTGTWFDRLFGFGKKILQRTPERGAESVLYAATTPGLRGGYIGPDGFLELYGSPHLSGCSARARDPETARRLWELSERVTGVQFRL